MGPIIGNSVEKAIVNVIALAETDSKDSGYFYPKVAHSEIRGLHSTGHKLYGTAASAGLVALSGLARRFEKLRDEEQGLLDTLITQTKRK